MALPLFHWKREPVDARDKIYKPTAMVLPKTVDLRPYCSPIEDQGQLGSCTGNAIAGIIECLDRKAGKNIDVSRLFIYYEERLSEGTVSQDSGAYIRDGIKVVNKKGAPLESLWPYNINKFAVRPSTAAYTDALKRTAGTYEKCTNLAAIKNALARGFPVVIGFDVYDSFYNIGSNGIMTYPKVNREQLLGGHAVAIVGYNDNTNRLIARNSWGPNWGDRGYFYMPYQVIQDTTMSSDFWTITSINNPLTSTAPETVKTTLTPVTVNTTTTGVVSPGGTMHLSAPSTTSTVAPGPIGPQGPKGDKGDAGAQGIQGIQGPKGDKGDKGDQGPPGEVVTVTGEVVTGPQGLPGRDGVDGRDGAQGPQGEKGETGPQGEQGLPGRDGTHGRDGIAGPMGPKGETGEKGDRGLQGETGAKGETGADGAQGIQGVAGPKGDTGAQGPQGIQGLPGKDGTNGKDGLPGAQGPAGPAGPQGLKGDTGAAGPATTNLLNQKIILNNVPVATRYDSSDVPTWSASYTSQGGQLLVRAEIVGWTGSVGSKTWNLKRNGTVVATGTFFFNIANTHMTLPALQYIDTAGAGTTVWSISLGAGLIVDVNDFATITVSETVVTTPVTSTATTTTTTTAPAVGGPPVVGGAINPMAPVVVTAPQGYKAASLDDGVELTLDTIAVQLATTGSRSLQFRVTSGTLNVNISGEYMCANGSYGGNYGSNYWGGNTLTTTYQQIFGWSFPWANDKAVYFVQDLTNRRFYRITLFIGPGYKKNIIIMERLV